MAVYDEALDSGSLARRVYEDLKRRLNSGSLAPGAFLDLRALGAELGMSRTPLREALIRLELEGFVEVFPRRGVVAKPLGLAEIRDLYGVIGALEAQAALSVEGSFGPEQDRRLGELDLAMRESLAADDFARYYEANLAFHETWIELAGNADLARVVRIRKERLYDFPRLRGYVRDWELESVEEHREIARRFAARDFRAAADYIRDVHWSFAVQERFVRAYHLAGRGAPPRATPGGAP